MLFSTNKMIGQFLLPFCYAMLPLLTGTTLNKTKDLNLIIN